MSLPLSPLATSRISFLALSYISTYLAAVSLVISLSSASHLFLRIVFSSLSSQIHTTTVMDKALEGGAPGNKELGPGEPQVPVSTGHKHHDTSVTFEEYHYWAKIARADERYENPNHDYTVRGKVLKKSRHPPAIAELEEANASVGIGDGAAVNRSDSDEKVDKEIGAKEPQRNASRAFTITDEEYVTASRAVRTATWGAVFYLITTDILGPFATPFAFAAVSYTCIFSNLIQ